MMGYMKYFSLLFLFCLLTPIQAEIYKGVNADGQTIYSDQNLPNTKKIPRPTDNTIQMPKLVIIQPAYEDKDDEGYSYLNIDSPTNDQTVRNNLGKLSVQISITPALHTEDEHFIALYLNDEMIFPITAMDSDEQNIELETELDDQDTASDTELNDSNTTSNDDIEDETDPGISKINIPLSNIDRGTHIIYAEVLDADEEALITSDSVTFHMKRNSIQHNTSLGSRPGPVNSDGNPYAPGSQGIIFKPGPIIDSSQ